MKKTAVVWTTVILVLSFLIGCAAQPNDNVNSGTDLNSSDTESTLKQDGSLSDDYSTLSEPSADTSAETSDVEESETETSRVEESETETSRVEESETETSREEESETVYITYIFKGRLGETVSTAVLEENAAVELPAAPEYEGYIFVRWEVEATDDATVYTAIYKEAVTEYTVTFKDADGNILKAEKVKKGGAATPPSAPAKEGYTFIGWDKDHTNIQAELEIYAVLEKIETADEWLSNIVFGINYFNGINESNDNDAYFRWISEQGFNAVEIGCKYAHLVDGVYGDLNFENVEKLRSIIDCAYKYDLYIILSLYDDYAYAWTSLNYANQEPIIKMLNTSYKKLVENLNTYDDRLAISFCSEPRDYTDNLIDEEACDVLNNVNKEFVKMVRSTGGNNLYRKLAITTGWSKCNGLSASRFKMVDDEYTFVRIHLYQPDLFAGSKTEEALWDEAGHQLTLVDCFKDLKDYFIDKDIPVYIGEFGCRPKDNDEERIKWAECYLSLANSYNVKCFIWDTENKGSGIKNSFAISNKQKLEWLNPIFMDYILAMFKNNSFIDYYDTYSHSISINDPIELKKTVTNILTQEEKNITVSCDSDKLVLKDGKYYAKEPGEIIFTYSMDGFNYYYVVTVTRDIQKVDFELEVIRNTSTGYLQLWITTDGHSKTRLDYDWSSTDERVISVSKYSTITVMGDGKCSIIATHKETGATGMIDLVVANNEIVDTFVHPLE